MYCTVSVLLCLAGLAIPRGRVLYSLSFTLSRGLSDPNRAAPPPFLRDEVTAMLKSGGTPRRASFSGFCCADPSAGSSHSWRGLALALLLRRTGVKGGRPVGGLGAAASPRPRGSAKEVGQEGHQGGRPPWPRPRHHTSSTYHHLFGTSQMQVVFIKKKKPTNKKRRVY